MAEAPEGFLDFVRARTPTLARTAFLLTGDIQLAEDLLQSALARAAARWGNIHTDPEPYVRRILYRERVNWWRRRRVQETLAAAVPDTAAPRDDVERRLVIAQALRRLTPRQRAVLVLRYYEDRSEAETADILGVAVGTVKSQTRHALTRLRALAPELADFAPQSTSPTREANRP